MSVVYASLPSSYKILDVLKMLKIKSWLHDMTVWLQTYPLKQNPYTSSYV